MELNASWLFAPSPVGRMIIWSLSILYVLRGCGPYPISVPESQYGCWSLGKRIGLKCGLKSFQLSRKLKLYWTFKSHASFTSGFICYVCFHMLLLSMHQLPSFNVFFILFSGFSLSAYLLIKTNGGETIWSQCPTNGKWDILCCNLVEWAFF